VAQPHMQATHRFVDSPGAANEQKRRFSHICVDIF